MAPWLHHVQATHLNLGLERLGRQEASDKHVIFINPLLEVPCAREGAIPQNVHKFGLENDPGFFSVDEVGDGSFLSRHKSDHDRIVFRFTFSSWGSSLVEAVAGSFRIP